MDHYLRIEVERVSSQEAFEVHAGRALVGSAAHCDVRLALDESAPEHLLVSVRGDKAHVRVLSEAPRCFRVGNPVHDVELASGDVLTLGALALRFRVLEAGVTAQKSSSDAVLPGWLQAVLLLGIAAGFYAVVAQGGGHESVFAEDVALPPLFSDAPAACGYDGDAAVEAGLDGLLRLAESKRERAPFRPREGVESARLYSRASACLQALGRNGEARAMAQEAALLRRGAIDELRRHRVRLERFLSAQRLDLAKREALGALALIHDDAEPYARWLASVRREIDLRQSQDERSAP